MTDWMNEHIPLEMGALVIAVKQFAKRWERGNRFKNWGCLGREILYFVKCETFRSREFFYFIGRQLKLIQLMSVFLLFRVFVNFIFISFTFISSLSMNFDLNFKVQTVLLHIQGRPRHGRPGPRPSIKSEPMNIVK